MAAKIVKLAEIADYSGSRYPAPHDALCTARVGQRLAEAVGLTQFGVNLVCLPLGIWASQRHWHSHEDELIYTLSGTVRQIDDDGERVLGPRDVVGYPAGDGDGHNLVNRGGSDAVFLAVGTRSPDDVCHYPDIDMETPPDRYRQGAHTCADGSPWPGA